MKLVFYFGFILFTCGFYLVTPRFIGYAFNKDYPGMCFYNDTQTPIKIGSTYRPTSECVEITCREDFVLKLEYCPFYMIGQGCKVTLDKGAEYPDCCAKFICPNKTPENN